MASGKNRAFFPEQDLDSAGAPKPSCEGVCVCVTDVWSEAYMQHVWDMCHACLYSMSLWGRVLHAKFLVCVCVTWKRGVY